MHDQIIPQFDTIANGDCLDLLRSLTDESIDVVVSSPPYNIGKEYESRRALNIYLDEQALVLRECNRVLKPTGSIFWQVGSYSNNGSLIPLDVKLFPIIEDLGMIPRNRIVWLRQHGLHAKNKFSGRHETILWFTKTDTYKFFLDAIRVPQKWSDKKYYRGDRKGELSCNPLGKNPGDIWAFRNVKHNHEEQTVHPCQFPEDLIARVVLSTTEAGDTVLDPYMGTGTVAVVARDHGRHFIGSEIDPAYHRVALRRLSGEPDENNCFPNLRTLRDYIERTGDDINKYRFDMQVGDRASDRSKAKIFSEEEHLNEYENRVTFEEDHWAATLSDSREAPAAPQSIHRVTGTRHKASAEPTMFDDITDA